MNVREIAASELPRLLELYQHLDVKDDSVVDRDTVEAIWQELRVSPYHKYFGAYVEGHLVSSCALTLMPNLTRGCRPYGVVENVVTDPNYRKQGLATAILKEALEYSWSKNCYKIMLFPGQDGEVSSRLYETVGFDRYSKQAFIATPPASNISL